MVLRFDNQTVVVTGVRDGLRRLYSTHFASRSANVVVHDHLNKVWRTPKDIQGLPKAKVYLIVGSC